MTLMEIIKQCGARVCGGSDFQWDCFGDNARYIDFADVVGEEYCSIVHDKQTYEVYEICIHIPGQDQAFKWVNPAYEKAYINECSRRGLTPHVVYDDVKYTTVDHDTIMQYAKDVGEMYYDDLPIPEDQL